MHTARGAEVIRLTELTTCGGCAAKWGAHELAELLEAASHDATESLLVGLRPSDDAAVLKVAEGLALVSTTDFFPPLVDDPDDYGAIAAANACSDVFAMGGDVVLALNIAGFPESVPVAVLQAIFSAAARVVSEAGGIVAGGHTIRTVEPIFGLAVQGVVDPRRVFTKGGARPGDVLVISKPVGTGLALASGEPEPMSAAVMSMRQLNRTAATLLRDHAEQVHAVTDVTGFGLLGHGWEIAERSDVRLVFAADALPMLPGVLEVARAGLRTGGDVRNRDYLARCDVTVETDEARAAVVFDPQTSGGLLACVAAKAVEDLTRHGFVRIGQVTTGSAAVVLR